MSKHGSAQAPTIQPRLLSRDNAATFLSVSPRLLDTLVRRGEISPVRVPGVRRVAFDTGELGAVVDRWKSGTPSDVEASS